VIKQKIECFYDNYDYYYHTMKSLLTLPSDIVKEIADYTGIVKIRNGKYMTQIAKTDPRYDILKTIPQKKIFPKTPMRNFISTVILSGGFSFQMFSLYLFGCIRN
jgi:hypothetical protein